MDALWTRIGIVGLLVLVNAVFAGSEIALISLRSDQVRTLDTGGGPARAAAALARDPNRFLATVQIGITLAGFLASAAAAVTFAEDLVGVLGFLGAGAQPVSLVLVTTALTYVTLVVGELAPKRLAMQHPERWALYAARPLTLLGRLARPALWLLDRSTNAVVRVLGGDPTRTRADVTREELRDLLVHHPGVEPLQRSVMAGAFEVADRILREVMVARPAVQSFRAETPADVTVAALLASGRSRAPVHSGDLDDLIGLVHLRDLVHAGDTPVGQLATDMLVLPETLGVLPALRRLQTSRQQLAAVVDEHGGVAGVVSVEDLLEEIVGEIYDEYDRDVRAVVRTSDGSIVVPATFPVHDLVDLGVVVAERPGGVATVGGLVLDVLGRIPRRGDGIDLPGWRIEVLEVRRHGVRRVRLVPRGQPPGDAPVVGEGASGGVAGSAGAAAESGAGSGAGGGADDGGEVGSDGTGDGATAGGGGGGGGV